MAITLGDKLSPFLKSFSKEGFFKLVLLVSFGAEFVFRNEVLRGAPANPVGTLGGSRGLLPMNGACFLLAGALGRRGRGGGGGTLGLGGGSLGPLKGWAGR